MWPYVITVCNITVPLERLNLHNTLNIKMERSVYEHDRTYRFVCLSGAPVGVERFRVHCDTYCVTSLLKYKVIGHLFQENISM
jgi:hypothetical protein